MRTNIDLDDALVERAMKLTDVRTKKELVHQALHEFVENHGRRDMRELRGRVRFRDDYRDFERMAVAVPEFQLFGG